MFKISEPLLSSLLLFTEYIAKGEIEAGDNTTFNFLCVSTDIGGCSSYIEIVQKIARSLKTEISLKEEFKHKASGFWEWITKWEVLGVRFHKEEQDIDANVITELLIDNIAGLCKNLSEEIDGLIFLIDEADRPDSNANLGQFLKTTNERLARLGCLNVGFGLAALPSVLAKLKDSHESSPRLFETLTLEPLEKDECETIIKMALEEANNKNELQTTITDEAVELLTMFSEGYPHFLQQFGYSGFAANSDGKIIEQDIINGAFGENGALAQLGYKYFNDMYHLKINSDDYRLVLRTMAKHGDDWLSKKKIVEESAIKDATVTNALAALKARKIIIADDARRGFYRLPTRSFATWINVMRLSD